MFQKFFSLVFIFYFITGCSSVTVFYPSPSLEAPETLPAKQSALGFGAEGGRAMTVSGINSRPPTFDLSHQDSADVFSRLRYSFVPGLEANARLLMGGGNGLTDFGFSGGAKYQLIGKDLAAAKSGDFSMALFAGAHGFSSSANGDQSNLFGSGGYKWKAGFISVTYDYGISSGYRIGDPFLIYVGYSRADTTLKLNLIQDPNTSDQPDPGGSWDRKFTTNGRSVGVGLRGYFKTNSSIELQYKNVAGQNDVTSYSQNVGSLNLDILLK